MTKKRKEGLLGEALMRCWACDRKFKDQDPVIPIQQYITNEKRGDFVGNLPIAYAHARHIMEE